MRRTAGRIETWLTCPIVLFMAVALVIALVFPSWPWWVRAIPLGLAGLLIMVAFYYSLLPPNRPPPPDHSPK
jgi:hypothetical protein